MGVPSGQQLPSEVSPNPGPGARLAYSSPLREEAAVLGKARSLPCSAGSAVPGSAYTLEPLVPAPEINPVRLRGESWFHPTLWKPASQPATGLCSGNLSSPQAVWAWGLFGQKDAHWAYIHCRTLEPARPEVSQGTHRVNPASASCLAAWASPAPTPYKPAWKAASLVAGDWQGLGAGPGKPPESAG